MIKKQLLIMSFLILAVVFLPATILLGIGMLPTIVAAFVDRTPERLKAMTVGGLNFAACFPFLIALGGKGHTPEAALSLITNPQTIIIMYAGAACGYLLEYGLALSVSKIMVQQARARMKKLKQEQAQLVTRWGPEVAGEMMLDPQGFPLEEPKDTAKESKEAKKQ